VQLSVTEGGEQDRDDQEECDDDQGAFEPGCEMFRFQGLIAFGPGLSGSGLAASQAAQVVQVLAKSGSGVAGHDF
jgi:hypothetical protein